MASRSLARLARRLVRQLFAARALYAAGSPDADAVLGDVIARVQRLDTSFSHSAAPGASNTEDRISPTNP